MSTPLPERADMTHLRHQAKALLTSLLAHEPDAVHRAAKQDPSLQPANAKLADAQRVIAREYGFPTWTRLKDHVETPQLRAKFAALMRAGDAAGVDRLLTKSAAIRREIDHPHFDFDSPAIVRFAANRSLVDVLLKHGANPNARSSWWAGGFGALDLIPEAAAEYLVQRGATWDVWSAAAHGRAEELMRLLDADPSLANAPGGDGMRPLHFAKRPEIAALLLDRGADPNVRDIDHEGTPAQHLVNEPDVVRLLLSRGAEPDIFLAAAINDADLVRRLILEDPNLMNARVGIPPFKTTKSDGGHIYLYTLGGGKAPYIVAVERSADAALAELLKHASPAQQLVAAAWLERESEVDRIIKAHPGLGTSLGSHDSRALPDAAEAGRVETVRLLLRAGLDPKSTVGRDGGTALHTAAWFGQADVIELVLPLVPIETRDRIHGSTPLGWALHGAQHCRNPKGDYVRSAELILAAGAALNVAANGGGTSYLDQAGDREDVKDVLRRYGQMQQ